MTQYAAGDPSDLPTDPSTHEVLHPPVAVTDLTRVLDQMPGMVAVWDRNLANVFANRAYIEWFGISPEDMFGKTIREVLGEDLYALNRPYIEGALEGEVQLFERTMVDAAGRTRNVQVNYTPQFADGRPDGFSVLVSDITARVRSETALSESVRHLALLEERQRIAADLHDRVIQRLFAAGLDLAAYSRDGERSAPRVAAAALGVDEAIRELRRSIHSLQELMSPHQVPATIERILDGAGRSLGFMPSMTYTGSLDAVPDAAIDHLLAVLNEALSNVARHAAATEVSVTLACGDEHVVLRVADDGRGLSRTERSSGLSNMRQRAVKLGGTFSCLENHPRGTIVEWTIPSR